MIAIGIRAIRALAVRRSVSDGSFVYYYDFAATPPSLNFAHAVGGLSGSFAPSLNAYVTAGTLYYSRLTTTAP